MKRSLPLPVDTALHSSSPATRARQEWRHAYLIDGVAINGVSGGPVVIGTETDGVQIVGTISAYVSNRATGEALPGLSMARDVSHFHDTIKTIRSLDDAARQKAAQQKEQQEQQAAPSAGEQPPAAQPPAPQAPAQTAPLPAGEGDAPARARATRRHRRPRAS